MLDIRLVEPADSDDIFLWRNDPESIRMSLSEKPVTLEEHKDWFFSSLAGEKTLQFIGEMEKSDNLREKVGVCRFDRHDDSTWLVSINVNPDHRGLGLSRPLLNGAISNLRALKHNQPIHLKALVRQENTKSLTLFTGCLFTIVDVSDGVVSLSRQLVQKDSGSATGPIERHS